MSEVCQTAGQLGAAAAAGGAAALESSLSSSRRNTELAQASASSEATDGDRLAVSSNNNNNNNINNNNNNSASNSSDSKAANETITTTTTERKEHGSGCSSATDNRSSSSSSSLATMTGTTTTTTTSSSAASRSRAGSSTTSMSKFKEKRPEPLKFNQANLAHNNQEIPLDLSVKSAGYVPSGFLGNIFNNALAAAAAANQSQHMTTLETPRIVWQDNDALLVKGRLFSSSNSATSQQRARLASLAGESPPMTPGTPLLDGPAGSPSSMMLCSPIDASATQLNRQHQRGFLSPLFNLNHFPPTKPMSAGHNLARDSSQSLQSALMSAHLQYNKQQYQQQVSSASGMHSSREDPSSQYQAMLEAAKLHSPFQLELRSMPSGLEAYLRAPRRSCSTENLANSRNPLLSSFSSASDHQQRHQTQPHNHQQQNRRVIKLVPPGSKISHRAQQKSASNQESTAASMPEPIDQQQQNNRFSYSGQQIAAAAAELSKSQSPIINVIEGSSASSNEDTRDSNSSSGRQPSVGKALTPTSLANATANLLNIRLNSPSNTTTPTKQEQQQQIDDPLISAAYCREQRGLFWNNSASDIGVAMAPTSSTTTSCGGSSLGGSLSTTLNTPTLISPSHFKGGSICFLPSPTLSPMSSVFELPSPLLMFPPPPQTTSSSSAAAVTAPSTATAARGDRQQQQSNCQVQWAKTPSNPSLAKRDEGSALSSQRTNNVALGISSPPIKPKATSDSALSGEAPMQIDPVARTASDEINHQQQQQREQFDAPRELAHLVTCARDKIGLSADNDDADNDCLNENECDADEDDVDADIGGGRVDQDDCMDIDPQQQRPQVERASPTIPRILVSDCLTQRQQQQLVEHGRQSAGEELTMVSGQRQPVSKRALSPQLHRSSIYQRERLASSSAPPDVYQGMARPKLKSVNGGSAIDFQANPGHQIQSTTNFVALSSDQIRTQQQQYSLLNDNNQNLSSQYYHSRQSSATATVPRAIAAPANRHAPYAARPDWMGAQEAAGGHARQSAAIRPNSADPTFMLARSATALYQPQGEYLSNTQQQEHSHYSNMAPTIISGSSSGFSHSAQHLNGYVLGSSSHVADPFLQAARDGHHQQQQSVSVGELSRSAQIHQSCQVPIGGNPRAGPSSFQQAGTLMTNSGNQLMGGHHNQPDGSAASGMSPQPDHSLSTGELDSLLHHQIQAPALVGGQTLTNQSLSLAGQHHQTTSPIQGQQQRAASACSLSLGASYDPSTSVRQQQQSHYAQPLHHHNQQQQQHQRHQLESFSGGSGQQVPAMPATSFRSNSVAGSTVSSGQQSHLAASSAAAAAAAVKKYRCDECSKAFTRSDMLTRHKRLHSGDRPFQCNECKQEFSRSDHLSTHMRTHTGEKPYRCKLCSYSACRKDMITRHMKVHNRSSPSVGPRPLSTGPSAMVAALTHSNSSDLSSLQRQQ